MLKKIRFSLGVQINIVLGAVIVLFILFSLYNYRLMNQFQNTYLKQTNMYYKVMNLKNIFTESNMAIENYFKNGNRTDLAQFNNDSQLAREEIRELYSEIESIEAIYLISSIENTHETYFNECCTGAFMYNTSNLNYYNQMLYTKRIQEYLLKYCDELLESLLEKGVEISNELKEKQHMQFVWNIVVIVGVIIIFFSFIIYLNLSVMRPINDLVVQARQISKGNLKVRVISKNPESTVGILAKTFNNMARDIEKMLENMKENVKIEMKLIEEQKKNDEYQRLLEQATFLALQSQINPHFLFNTLNSISRTITLNKQEAAIFMIDSLARLLRYSLSNTQEPVLLAQEIEITSHYLGIQKLRFGERIQDIIICDPMINKEIMIPKFTLQPLVENAIVHGLEPKEEGGKIIIKVNQKRNMCYIKIFDNGIGISKEKQLEIIEDVTGNKRKSIGINNTKRRIEMFTGRKDSFTVMSKEKEGTLIVIKLFIGGCKNV